MPNCGIYAITHTLSGKIYVGQSTNLVERKRKHSKGKAESPIGRAIHEYGWEAFEFTVLEHCEVENLYSLEIKWIKELDTFNTGYNSRSGGDRKEIFNPETKERMSEASKIWYADPQNLKERQDLLASVSHREKQALIAGAKKHVFKHLDGRVLERYVYEMALEFKLHQTNLRNLTRGKVKSCGGWSINRTVNA